MMNDLRKNSETKFIQEDVSEFLGRCAVFLCLLSFGMLIKVITGDTQKPLVPPWVVWCVTLLILHGALRSGRRSYYDVKNRQFILVNGSHPFRRTDTLLFDDIEYLEGVKVKYWSREYPDVVRNFFVPYACLAMPKTGVPRAIYVAKSSLELMEFMEGMEQTTGIPIRTSKLPNGRI
jgi:hypothetical protein